MSTPGSRQRLIACALLTLGIAAGLLGVCRALNPFDEAIVLVGAERILNGELPFRDFYALYPPGQYYVGAALLDTFGHSPLALRVYCVVVRAVIALFLYLSARRLMPQVPALACWAACALWLSGSRSYGYPVFPAVAFGLLFLNLLAASVDRLVSSTRSAMPCALGAGASLGATAWFRHDVAVYALMAGVPWLFALGAARPVAARRPFWGALVGATMLTMLPGAWLLLKVPAREVIFELFTYPLRTYPLVRGIPYPPVLPYPFTRQVFLEPQALVSYLADLPAYAPLVFYALGFLVWGARIRRGGRAAFFDSRNLTMLSIVLFGSLAFNLARVRADPIHGMTMLVVSYVVAVALLVDAWRLRGGVRIPLSALLAAGILATLPTPVGGFVHSAVRLVSGTPDREGGTHCCDAGAARESAAAYIRSIVPPGGRIFVGCSRHDAILMNEPIIYFLSGRLPGTMYHALDPGIANTLPVQRDIVAGLIRHRVDVVVLSARYDGVSEPNLSASSSGVSYLDDFLRSHYEPDRRFDPYLVVYHRRSGGFTPGEVGR